MNIASFLSKVICSGPFSFGLGTVTGLVALYIIHKAREDQKMHQTLQEIEAMVKALEMKAQKEVTPAQ